MKLELTFKHFARDIRVNRFARVESLLSVCGKLVARTLVGVSAFHVCVRSFVLLRFAIGILVSLDGHVETIGTKNSRVTIFHRKSSSEQGMIGKDFCGATAARCLLCGGMAASNSLPQGRDISCA